MRTAISTTSKFWRRYPWSAEFCGTSPAGKTHQRGDGSLTFADGFGEVNGTWMTGTPPATSPGTIHPQRGRQRRSPPGERSPSKEVEVAQPIGAHAREVTARMRRCQKAIRDRYSDFNPEGLEKYLEQEKAQTNSRSKEIIDRIETTLQRVVLEELRRKFGDDESGGWIEGVPKTVRVEVGKRYEDDGAKRGGKENYFDLIHYRKIAADHWDLFSDIRGFGKKAPGRIVRQLGWEN